MEYFFSHTFLFIIFILFTFKFLLKRRRTNLPPSPLSLPILGHLHLIIKPPLHRALSRLSQSHGPILSLWFGSRRVFVISSPSAVEECFTKNDIVLANRPPLLLSKHLGYNYTTVVGAPYGDLWRNLRRIIAVEIFSTVRLNGFSYIRTDEVKRLLHKLSQKSRDDKFAKVELKSLLSELALNVIMRMVAGKRYYGEDLTEDTEKAGKFREIMKKVIEYSGVANPADYMPIVNWVGLSGGFEKKVVALAERMDVFLQGLIDEKRLSKGGGTMIDHLLNLQETQPEYCSDQSIKGLLLVMLLAGTDTSSVTVEWAMSNLLNHPQILKKARAEIDAQLGEEHLVDESDVSKLPYLQSIISETLRLYPAVPVLVPHLSSEDCTLEGFDLPRGTIVIVNAWALHRDPKLWADPERFKPERFDSGEDLSYKLMPFGLGRRACPGAGLAQRVLGLTLGSLIQCFEWERVGEEKVDMTEGQGLTMPKVVPLEAMCKARPITSKVLS